MIIVVGIDEPTALMWICEHEGFESFKAGDMCLTCEHASEYFHTLHLLFLPLEPLLRKGGFSNP